MREPHRTELARLIRAGAASRDVHDGVEGAGFSLDGGYADDAFVERELTRTEAHRATLIPLLERQVGRAPRILDFGCGTGGATVALAQSALGAEEVIGVDANPAVLTAARVRAAGHDVGEPLVQFRHVAAGAALPFADGSFDLVVAVSVMEFVTTARRRDELAAELRRVVAPGGFLYVATPRIALRDYHARFWFGDLRRGAGLAWASPPWRVRAWGGAWRRVALADEVRERARARVPWLPPPVLRALTPALVVAARWQRALWQRPATDAVAAPRGSGRAGSVVLQGLLGVAPQVADLLGHL